MHFRFGLTGFFVSIAMSVAPVGKAYATGVLSRDVLADPFLFVEEAINTFIYAEAAKGNNQKATCINDHYFGSPLATRMTVNEIWKHPTYRADIVIIAVLNNMCSGGKDSLGSQPKLWNFTNTVNISVEESDGAIAIDAGLRILSRLAASEKERDAGNCIVNNYTDDFFKRISDSNSTKNKRAFVAATFDAVRAACGYPKNAASGIVSVPPVMDFYGAARERLLAVRDLQSCESITDEKSRDVCVNKAFDIREKFIFNAALQNNSEELEKARAKRDEMDRSAWRLPDGRAIFEDKIGLWHFENGSIVDSALVATRIRPPK